MFFMQKAKSLLYMSYFIGFSEGSVSYLIGWEHMYIYFIGVHMVFCISIKLLNF